MSRLDDAAQIDITAFGQVENRHSAPVGWYFREPTSKADALDLVMGGILGWWKIRPDGRLAIGYVGSPVLGSSLSLNFKDEGMGKPRLVATAPPRAGTHVSWKINTAPQGRSELADSVDDETAAILGQEARYAQALSPHVATLYLQDRRPEKKHRFTGCTAEYYKRHEWRGQGGRHAERHLHCRAA